MKNEIMTVAITLALAGCSSVADKNNGDVATNNGSANNANNGTVGNNGMADGECLLHVDLTGGVTESIVWGLGEGCGGGGGSEENRVTVGFGGITTDLNVKITLTDATKEVVGDGLPAEVLVRIVETDEQWLAADCTVDLTTNEIVDTNAVGDSVLLEGTGSCASAAVAVDPNTGDPVEVGAFEFKSTALW